MDNNEATNNEQRVENLFQKLKGKLTDFHVLDQQSQFVGIVKDLILDNQRQIKIVVFDSIGEHNSLTFLIASKFIQKIDPVSKSVLIGITKKEIAHLPEYVTEEIPDIGTSKMPSEQEELNEVITPSSYTETAVEQGRLKEEIAAEVLEEEVVRLLEERLVVERSKRKVGEVVVRKEIETRILQVPVRREKLIVEQVSPEYKQLAEIELGQEEVDIINTDAATHTDINTSATTATSNAHLTVKGEFSSPKVASLLLNAIALERHQGCKKVRIEIVVEDAERQKTYQQWIERCSDTR